MTNFCQQVYKPLGSYTRVFTVLDSLCFSIDFLVNQQLVAVPDWVANDFTSSSKALSICSRYFWGKLAYKFLDKNKSAVRKKLTAVPWFCHNNDSWVNRLSHDWVTRMWIATFRTLYCWCSSGNGVDWLRKPPLHVETFSRNLCATALRNKFKQALRDKFHEK